MVTEGGGSTRGGTRCRRAGRWRRTPPAPAPPSPACPRAPARATPAAGARGGRPAGPAWQPWERRELGLSGGWRGLNGLPCPPPSAQGREEEVLGEGRMGMDGERGKERAAGFIGSSAMEASVESIPAFRGCSKEQKRLALPPGFWLPFGCSFLSPRSSSSICCSLSFG